MKKLGILKVSGCLAKSCGECCSAESKVSCAKRAVSIIMLIKVHYYYHCADKGEV